MLNKKRQTQLDRIEHHLLHLRSALRKGFKIMSEKSDRTNAAIAAIGANVDEIATDIQTLLDTINATPGDGLTGAETDAVIASLEALASKTRATADVVPPKA
jgi:hypothetical protein